MKRVWWMVLVLLGINIFFNWRFVKELVSNAPGNNLSTTDGRITEWIVETGYQKIIHGQNPFAPTTKLFYPFETKIALNDPGMLLVVPYAVFRPWLGIHQAMMGAVLLSLFLSSLAMYLLLSTLVKKSELAILLALVYTYMPYVSGEVRGHYTYLCLYLFPWIYLLIYKNNWVGAGIVAALFWYGNFYYGVSIMMAGVIYGAFFGYAYIKVNYRQMLAGLTAMVVVLSPWLVSVRDELMRRETTRVFGYGGAVQLAKDLVELASPKTWGVVLLLLLGYVLIKYKKIGVAMISSMWFAILTMGPFLKVLGRWHINLDGVEVFFPLPFLLLRSLPGLESLRAPDRFIPAMIFFACIAVATLLTKTKKWIVVGLGVIFLLTQHYSIPYRAADEMPMEIYETLGRTEGGVVMEIPFALRDGFEYRGFIYGLNPMYGQLIHHRSIMGGYLARVDTQVFDYYDKLSWISHILKITDHGNYNRFTELPKEPVVTEYAGTTQTVKSELDLLNITDVIVKRNEPYTQQIENMLNEVGAEEVRQVQGYSWWRRE
ncbi:MAG: hypothetical protein ABII21_04340 [bacterium]